MEMSRDAGRDIPPFEPRSILEVMVRNGVRFIVIGGVAGQLHGSNSYTYDVDICYARTPENIERLSTALQEIGVTLRGADEGLPFKPDARTIKAGLNFTFKTPLGDLDCLGEASGYTYEVLAPNAHPAALGGLTVEIADLDDLIRMKRAAGRLKDLVEIENLSKLRDVREERGLYGLAEPVASSPTGSPMAPAAQRSLRASRSGAKARSR